MKKQIKAIFEVAWRDHWRDQWRRERLLENYTWTHRLDSESSNLRWTDKQLTRKSPFNFGRMFSSPCILFANCISNKLVIRCKRLENMTNSGFKNGFLCKVKVSCVHRNLFFDDNYFLNVIFWLQRVQSANIKDILSSTVAKRIPHCILATTSKMFESSSFKIKVKTVTEKLRFVRRLCIDN